MEIWEDIPGAWVLFFFLGELEARKSTLLHSKPLGAASRLSEREGGLFFLNQSGARFWELGGSTKPHAGKPPGWWWAGWKAAFPLFSAVLHLSVSCSMLRQAVSLSWLTIKHWRPGFVL